MNSLAGQKSKAFAILIAVTAAAVGIIYGYDSGSITGALPFLKRYYSLTTAMVETVTTAATVGSVLGAITGGRLADALGRKKIMILVVTGFGLFALLSAIPFGPWWLIVVRLFLGYCIGVSIVVAPMFVAEFAPAKTRGSLLVVYQVAQSCGLIAAYFIGYAFSFSGNWQFILGIAVIPAILIIIGLWRFPDTPRWYMLKGHREKAVQILSRIEEPENVYPEIERISDELQVDKGRFTELFTKKFRKATLFVIGFGFFVHITGNNAIHYYTPFIFNKVGLNVSHSIFAGAIIQVAALLAELISFVVIDRWGRRPTILTGIGAMVVSIAAVMIIFFRGDFQGVWTYLAFTGILIFSMGFGFGFGSLVWVYASECFPSRLRGTGASTLMTADMVSNVIVTSFFLTALNSFGGGFTFGGFMVLCILAWIFIFILAPETKRRSLEQIHKYWEQGGKWEA